MSPRRIHYAACAFLTVLVEGRFIFGNGVGAFDWPKELFYYAYLKQALLHHHVFPRSFLAVPPEIAQSQTLQRAASYLANPEVMLASPLLPLLLLLPLVAFFKLNFAAHLACGAWGTWRLGEKLGWPPWGARALYALVLLHPSVLQHVALGYTPYVTVALAPAIVALLCGQFSRRELAAATLLYALMLYEGGLHIFLWFSGALVLTALLMRRVRRVFLLLVGTTLLALPRLIATGRLFGAWQRGTLGGYGSLSDVWGLLTDFTTPPFQLPTGYGLYGSNYYDGAVGAGAPFVIAALIALLLMWRGRRNPTSIALGCGALVVMALGWGSIWWRIASVVPVLGVEKYPYRLLFVASVMGAGLIVLEAIRLAERGGVWRWLAPSLLAGIAVLPLARNFTFAELATVEPDGDAQAEKLLREWREELLAFDEHGALPTEVTPNRLRVTNTRDARWIRFPALRVALPHDFEIVGATRLEPLRGGLRLLVTPGRRTVEVRAHGLYFEWMVLAGILLWLGFLKRFG